MQTLPRLYRWTRAEYERLAEQGAFEGKRVELIGGMIVEMAAKGPVHSVRTNQVRKALERSCPLERFTVRIQEPLALGEWDEPESDVAAVIGQDADFRANHPTADQTVLVVEIADSSVAFDLGRQGRPLCRRRPRRLLGRQHPGRHGRRAASAAARWRE
jgi:hypothetical protein